MIAPARRAAFEVVRRVFEDGAYADRAFAAAAAGLDQRDRALAQRIAYGTVQRMRTIDHGIDALGTLRALPDEVAHLIEMNHGPRFWRLVATLVPDSHAPRAWLKRHRAELLAYS